MHLAHDRCPVKPCRLEESPSPIWKGGCMCECAYVSKDSGILLLENISPSHVTLWATFYWAPIVCSTLLSALGTSPPGNPLQGRYCMFFRPGDMVNTCQTSMCVCVLTLPSFWMPETHSTPREHVLIFYLPPQLPAWNVELCIYSGWNEPWDFMAGWLWTIPIPLWATASPFVKCPGILSPGPVHSKDFLGQPAHNGHPQTTGSCGMWSVL